MKAMVAITGWAAQFGALYAWDVLDIRGAGNLLTAWIVFLACAAVLAALIAPAEGSQERALPKQISRPLGLLFLALLIWFGHGVLAACYSAAWIGTAIYAAKFDPAGLPKTRS